MFLAIGGNVNSVFRLQSPDVPTIKKHLSSIPHDVFKTQKEAYAYINVENIPKQKDNRFQFQECVRTLKTSGIIPTNEIVVAFSPIQNIENDTEREKVYDQRKTETKLNKLRKVQEDNNTAISEEKHNITFVTEITEIKNLNNEISINNSFITSEMFTEGMRQHLLEYVRAGGNKHPFGIFKGKVLEISNNSILFEKLFMHFKNENGNFKSGAESHIWMPDCKAFKDAKIQVGDCVQFKALAYFYQRPNGTIDISLKAPHSIKFIKKYRLPK